MSNPVLTKFEKDTRRAQVRQAPPPSPADLQRMYDQRSSMPPGYAPPAYNPYQQPNQAPPQPGTGFPPGGGGVGGGWGGGGGDGGGAASRPMTIDDVVTRSVAMWGVLFAAAAVSWFVIGTGSSAIAPILIVSLMAGLGLGLFISFTGKANAFTCLLYSVVEGVLLGAISRIFNEAYPGIAVQAVLATLVVAGVTFAAYKISGFRVTPKFTKYVIIGTASAFGLMIVNLIASFFVSGGLGLRSGGAIAIIFSLICIGLAVVNLVVDFDLIQRSIEQGAPEKAAWLASFGLMVTLIWLYIEILRLLSYFRN